MSMTDPLRLSQQQVAQYHRDGYLALDRITDTEDLQFLEGLLMGLFARHSELPPELAYELGADKATKNANVIPQVISPHKVEPRLLESRYYRNARMMAQQLLGEDCNFLGDHTIYKPPHNNKETPWHQDQAYWAKGTTAFTVNFWMPLRNAPVETGCMWFVPRSHLGDLLPHHPAGNNPNMHTLETDQVDPSKAIACPLPAGGATLHALKTLHYTGPNISDHPRLAYILTFGYEWLPDGYQKT